MKIASDDNVSISRKDPTLQSSCIIQYNFSSEDDDAYPGPSRLQSVACHESSTEQYLTNNSTSTSVFAKLVIGMREICPNNFGNNDRAKELRIIPEF